jgi:hypothetical protein
MVSTVRIDPSGFSRTPSRTSPDSGSTRVVVIQSMIAAVNSTFPTRAARIAAGPLAGALLKLSLRRHQIPPPPAGVHPSCSRLVIAASADGVDRRASGPGPLHGEPEPGDVVVVIGIGRGQGTRPDPRPRQHPEEAAQEPTPNHPLDQLGSVRPLGRLHAHVPSLTAPTLLAPRSSPISAEASRPVAACSYAT